MADASDYFGLNIKKVMAAAANAEKAGQLTPIADPSTATAEDVATLLNSLISTLNGE